jgi:heme/copper-type cytochrome/quinol oxidase subunit 2
MSRILAHEAAVTYPFPTFVFGLIAMGVFILLGLVTWSFRDVANRHNDKDTKGHH